MDLTTLYQRLGRVDLLDGVGIYVGRETVALAAVGKRLTRVALRAAETYPLPRRDRPAERRRALTEAVQGFLRTFNVDGQRAYLCLSRDEVLLSRLVLPDTARADLQHVVEYQIDRLLPMPREEIYYDCLVRDRPAGKLDVLVVAAPRQIVSLYMEALEGAFVRPRGIVIPASALADYIAFCGAANSKVTVLVGLEGDQAGVDVLVGGVLASSHACSRQDMEVTDAVARVLAHELAGEVGEGQEHAVHVWAGEVAGLDSPGGQNGRSLLSLGRGRLEAPEEFYAQADGRILPAIGAALGAVREGSVPLNLLPQEQRRGFDQGLTLTTIVLFGLALVLLVVWGVAGVVTDELARRRLREEIAALAPRVAEVRRAQAELDSLQQEWQALTEGQDRRVVDYLRELTELIPPTAYLTRARYRDRRIEIEGFAQSASELIPALEGSKLLRNVQFSSPTTKAQGSQERFSLVAEVEG